MINGIFSSFNLDFEINESNFTQNALIIFVPPHYEMMLWTASPSRGRLTTIDFNVCCKSCHWQRWFFTDTYSGKIGQHRHRSSYSHLKVDFWLYLVLIEVNPEKKQAVTGVISYAAGVNGHECQFNLIHLLT
jgi:hypothetical protein